MKNFNRKELARFNGKNGRAALVACYGKVYDVSESFLWTNGRHQVLHSAGEDLTHSMEETPHGIECLERFPVAGTYQE